MKKLIPTLLAAFVALAGTAMAHEGHEHKVMGKVVAIDDKKIDVEATDGKKVTGVLSALTKYTRDQAPAAFADVKVGERVVIVVMQEKDVQKVKEVMLGQGASEEHKH